MTADAQVQDVVLVTARAFEKIAVPYLLGGSVATSLQGDARATNVIDFAVQLEAPQVPLLIEALGADFSCDAEMLLAAVRDGRSANLFYLPLFTKIDLFFRGSHPFDLAEFSRRHRVALPPDGGEVWVASAEDNLLRKLWWLRKGGEVSENQRRDVQGLLRVGGQRLDFAYMRHWAPELGVADLLERALAT